uniref:Uncharacterized protein n=1 Tax=Panagrellus redivivus TaxID=6233 RepID=A0A7E4ZUL7_PANRE
MLTKYFRKVPNLAIQLPIYAITKQLNSHVPSGSLNSLSREEVSGSGKAESGIAVDKASSIVASDGNGWGYEQNYPKWDIHDSRRQTLMMGLDSMIAVEEMKRRRCRAMWRDE